MTTNKKIIQISLISIGIFLIMATYFFYPKIVENKFLKEQADKDIINKIDIADDVEGNTFENVEYKGLYGSNLPFTVQSKKAQILDDNPNLVYMTNMLVTLHAKDQRIIKITSLEGRYNKETFDLFFEKNVKVVDGETTVLAENLDLLSKDARKDFKELIL